MKIRTKVRIKKSLASLLAVFMIFSFTGNVFAEDATCNNCKCPVWAVPCPQEVGPQEVAGVQCPFDYETTTGYCANPDDARNCKVILDVCSCPQACKIQVGNVLGVKMEIVTPGVYWAENTSNIRFGMFPKTNIGAACADEIIGDAVPPTDVRSIRGIEFFRTDGVTPATPNPACRNTVADGDKAKILLSNDVTQGYVIQQTDTTNNLCQMWVDIPQMIINAAEFTNAWKGQDIKVRVGIFTDWTWVENADTYLCPDCIQPNLCECEITVAKFCCDEETENYSMLYPYFAEDGAESDFWNGIAITNLTEKAGTANLTIFESDGDVGTASISVGANSVIAHLLSGIPGVTVSKKGPGANAGTLFDQRCYIRVDTDFNADGFAMISDNAGMGASMGYLPRLPEMD